MADPLKDVDIESLTNKYGSSDLLKGIDVKGLINKYSGNEIVPEPVSSTSAWEAVRIPTPVEWEARKASGQVNVKGSGAPATPLSNVVDYATNLPTQILKGIGENYSAGRETLSSGLEDIRLNLPASGIGKIGLGALAMATSPLTGTIKATIEEPVTKLTGSQETGERAGMIATFGLPVGKAAKVVSEAKPSNKAVTALVDAIGPENLPQVIQRLQENPRLSLADVSPATRQMSQKLITTEGQHQNKFEEFVNDRITSAKGAVESIYNDVMGIPVNVLQKINELKQAAKNVGKNEINPAIKASGPVDLSGVISDIDNKLKPGIMSNISAGQPLPYPEIQKALESTRKLLTDNKSVRTNADDLHQFQSALRAKADDLTNSSSGQDRQIGYALMHVRNGIVNAIDAASGGKYKPGLSNFRDEKQVEDAFIKGAQITRNRPGQWDDRSEFWKEWVDNASKQQIEAAKEGARIAVQQQMKGMRFSAKKGTDIPEIEFNADKLGLLFGKKEVNQMMKELQDEKSIADTNQKLIQGSQTAMRMKSDKRVDLPTPTPHGQLALPAALGEIMAATQGGPPGIATAGVLALKGGYKLSDMVKLKLAKSRNERLTDLLTATGPDRDELIKTLSQYIPGPKSSLLQRAQKYALPAIGP